MKKYVALFGIIGVLVGSALFAIVTHPFPQVIPPLSPSPTIQAPQNASHDSNDSSQQNNEVSTGGPPAGRVATPLPVATPSPAQLAPITSAAKPTEIVTEDGNRFPIRRYRTAAIPNDPGATQWWTSSTGLSVAWDKGYGSYQTTVAVIDTGFGLAHEDLADRWALNAGESGPATYQDVSLKNCTDRNLPVSASCNRIDDNFDMIIDNESGYTYGENPSQLNCTDQGKPLDKSCNMIDDDGNGYTDDVRGWDFSNFDRSVQAGEVHPTGDGTMHGTMTSGVLGANGNNGKGIAGVNWNTKILPIQAIDDDGYGDTLTLSRSILYAVSRNVHIISLSLGSEEEDTYVRQAVQYAMSQGVMVVAASGNEGCDCISYPARYPEVLAVGSQDSDGNPSTFSNFGQTLDILAPGEDMILPAWGESVPTDGYVSGAAGTSFSTPFVAGLLAQLKSLQPTASYGELIAALNETADHTGLTTNAPWSNTRGYGLAHAGRSATRVTTSSSAAIRYTYSPLNTTTLLDSGRVHDCSGTSPSAVLYELSKNGQITYTVSELHRAIAGANGWINRSLGYHCVGQAIDTPGSTRFINLFHEIRNDYTKR